MAGENYIELVKTTPLRPNYKIKLINAYLTARVFLRL